MNVRRQTVPYPASDLRSQSLSIDGVTYNGTNIGFFQYTSATPAGGVTGPLVKIPGLGCTAEEWGSVDVSGKIAFVSRGNCTFVEKVYLNDPRVDETDFSVGKLC